MSQLTFITETFEPLVKSCKSCTKSDLLFVNIQCLIACSFEKFNFKLNCVFVERYQSALQDMLREYSHTNSESYVQIRSTFAKIQNFFLGDCFFNYFRTVCISRSVTAQCCNKYYMNVLKYSTNTCHFLKVFKYYLS